MAISYYLQIKFFYYKYITALIKSLTRVNRDGEDIGMYIIQVPKILEKQVSGCFKNYGYFY